jgi:glycerol-3-phosphate dehydrogenase (NAD(P)+)
MADFRPDIGVLGSGRFGLALAEIAARNGHNALLYTSIPERAQQLATHRCLPEVLPELEALHPNVEICTDPAVLARRCTLLLLTVSTEYFLRVLSPVGAALDGAHHVVHAVHTLEGERLLRVSDLIRLHSPVRQIGVIAGPTHVSELLSMKPNAAVVGSAFPQVIEGVERALGRENLRIYRNRDARGVELAAALGQIIALAVGVADGLDLGAATHATILTRGLHEIARIGEALGASAATFSGLAGLGRIVDALRRGEPNYQLGLDIARTRDIAACIQAAPPEAQGLHVVRQVAAWASEQGVELPIAQTIVSLVDGSVAPAEGMRRLMRSDSTDE